MLVPMAEEDESAFETAVSVVRAYAEQDEELKEALAFLVAEEARLGRPLQRVEWPEVLQAAIALPADAMSVQRMLGERLVATVAVELVDRWERMYGLLQAYRAREGSANVPHGHEEGGEKLGLWLSTQRTMHKAGRMAGERQAEAGGGGGGVGRGCGAVGELRAAAGVCGAGGARQRAEESHKEDGERLGVWLRTQRKRWQARGMSEEERKGRGERSERRGGGAAGGGGGGVGRSAAQWEKNYALLRAFVGGRGTPTCRPSTARRTERSWGYGCRISGSDGRRVR